MSIILPILANILLISFMGLGFFLIERDRASLGDFYANMLNGLCLGLTAVLVTTAPVTLGDGATVDARAGPVILAGVIAGPIGGLLAATMGGLARGFVGGSFAVSGIIVYAVYGLIGVAIRQFRIADTATLLKPRSISRIVFASLCGASAMFFMISPTSRAFHWLQNDLPFILIANTMSVTYAATIIGVAMNFLKNSAEVIEINQTLNLAKRAGRFGIWDFDISTGKLIWDNRSKELHGVEGAAFEGTFEDWSRHVHPDDLQNTLDAFTQALSDEKVFDTEYRVLLPDGRQKSIKGDAIVLRDSAGNAVRVVGSNIDLTDLRKTEAELAEANSVAVQAQKFETIGQLTGGVAHDFNNVLAVIIGNSELLQHELQNDVVDRDKARKLIDASIEATKRGAELTQNMLAYARKARLTPVRVDLNQVVRETEKWIRRTISSRIEIEVVLQANLWSTIADKVSTQSALVNLLVNARDAIDGSGHVTVETSNVRVDEDCVNEIKDKIPPGRYVVLNVADNGVGMPQETVGKIFDPFFTTKVAGKGTGLGLSMVQGFVRQSKGYIRVDSQPGKGAHFKLYFLAAPDAIDQSNSAGAKVLAAASREHSTERILLVEDQVEVLHVLREILKAEGFSVVAATNGDEALRLFIKDDQFDLVVTDIVMPGELQGPSLARAIREIRPDMRFMFLSGYADEATVHGNGLRSHDVRLMKPISRVDLLKAIEKRLSTS